VIVYGCRDPSIAARVRSLRVNPYIQNNAWSLWWLNYESSSERCKTQTRNAVDRLFRIKPRVLPVDPIHVNPFYRWHTEKMMVGIDPASSDKIYLSFDDVIGGIIDLFPSLSHVSSFVVEDYGQGPVYDIQPFYNAAWAGFGSNLRKLSFTMGLNTFPDVLHPSSLHFAQLQEVSITFLNKPAARIPIAGDTIRDVAVPFINRHKSTIQALSFASEHAMRFSNLFMSLCLFPVLQRIDVQLAFDNSVWSADSAFTRFLRDHAQTLCHIDVLDVQSWFLQPHVSPSIRTWIRDSASDEAFFRKFRSLIIPIIHETDFGFVMLAIQNSIGNLTKLALVGWYLSTEEVQAIIAMFSHDTHGTLRNLRLGVDNLTPPLVHLVDENFPQLQELSLYTSPWNHPVCSYNQHSNFFLSHFSFSTASTI
jgi:hypothetical protein